MYPSNHALSLFHTAVRHGSTIALQVLHNKLDYFDCAAATTCIRSRCTGLYFEGNDWRMCAKKVFKIYRRSGLGSVRVGDTVGIYYPHNHRWLGCGNLYCRARANCPGSPTSAYGFNRPNLWNQCGGEIFKIYACGRNFGSPIYPHDHVMLYHVGVKKWIGLENSRAEMRTCPGTVLPPPKNKYEACWGEVFELLERSDY